MPDQLSVQFSDNCVVSKCVRVLSMSGKFVKKYHCALAVNVLNFDVMVLKGDLILITISNFDS